MLDGVLLCVGRALESERRQLLFFFYPARPAFVASHPLFYGNLCHYRVSVRVIDYFGCTA